MAPHKSITSVFTPAPEPPTELGRMRVLSRTAGIRVSPLCLGAMSIGEAWKDGMGSMNKSQSFALLDAFVENGGNFIDTANNYQNEESEAWIGEWMTQRKNRDQMVIATKFTTGYRGYTLGKDHTSVNFAGNHKRSLHVSVRDSLRKLQTDWIDVLYVHWWDWTTSFPELMDSLHILVQQGKVLYLAISDTPAWIVSACNEYATAHGKTPFSIFQGRWNIMTRDMERDIIPMARHYGMAICPWDVLGGGKFQTKKALEERKKAGDGMRNLTGDRTQGQTEMEERISEALAQVASEHNIESVTAVALAWIMAKTPYVFPIIGGRKVEHLKDNIQALTLKLTEKQIEFLESVKPLVPEFPANFIGDDPHVTGETSGLLKGVAKFAWVKSGTSIDKGDE